MGKDEIKEETQIVKARFKETFANNLGRIRSERELSQEKLADMAGISLLFVCLGFTFSLQITVT